MKILIDADCLIKFTKAGLKEYICRNFRVATTEAVKKEVVDAGKIKGCLDALIVEKNIEDHIIKIIGEKSSKYSKGDDSLIEYFEQGGYDAIATDDTKLVRTLKASGISFVLPATLIYYLHKSSVINQTTAVDFLEKLLQYISQEEYGVIKLLLEEKHEG